MQMPAKWRRLSTLRDEWRLFFSISRESLQETLPKKDRKYPLDTILPFALSLSIYESIAYLIYYDDVNMMESCQQVSNGI